MATMVGSAVGIMAITIIYLEWDDYRSHDTGCQSNLIKKYITNQRQGYMLVCAMSQIEIIGA